MLDTLSEVETPEGVFLRLRAAGAVARAQAWVLDLLIRVGLWMAVAIPLGMLGQAGMGLLALVFFVLTWGYWVAFEVLWNGQTPGKRALGLRVVCADGRTVTWIPSILRTLLRTVDMLPGFYAAGLASTLIDRDARRLGDIVAGTLVVHAGELARAHPVADTEAVPPPLPLAPDEAAAIVDFAERGEQLTEARRCEMADLLEPLTGFRGAAGVQRLRGYANWLLGRS
jgi:uncharacterized RDD family membrane protein YckC